MLSPGIISRSFDFGLEMNLSKKGFYIYSKYKSRGGYSENKNYNLLKVNHKFKPDTETLEYHPAAQYWCRLGAKQMPVSIDRLFGASNNKSTIYRLNGAGPGNKPIIAKRAKIKGLCVERTIYESVLPLLPVRSLVCYGYLQEENQEYGWLFMEEARGSVYSESDPEHRRLASEWMALLHSVTARLIPQNTLPEITMRHYYTYLSWTKATISKHLSDTKFTREDIRLLTNIIKYFEKIENRWPDVISILKVFPACIVHSDFISKNVRVDMQNSISELLVMDWEAAGFGVPTEDLAGLDINIYSSFIMQQGIEIKSTDMESLFRAGRMMRSLAWISATCAGLGFDWLGNTLESLRDYEAELAILLKEYDW